MTSTAALTNVTLPYVLDIANKGYRTAAMQNPALAKGINTCKGMVLYEAVAAALNMPYQPLEEVLKLQI